MAKEWSVDPKSYELAQHFLPDGSEEMLRSLSTDIQDAVEAWFEWADHILEEPEPEHEPDSFKTLGLSQRDFI
jgi:hypothetical protein